MIQIDDFELQQLQIWREARRTLRLWMLCSIPWLVVNLVGIFYSNALFMVVSIFPLLYVLKGMKGESAIMDEVVKKIAHHKRDR